MVETKVNPDLFLVILNTFVRHLEHVKRSGRWMAVATLVALAISLGPSVTRSSSASPPNIPSIEVAVSYADTERNVTCSDCFPSPWCGSPGVQFIGSSTNYNGNPTDTSNCRGGDWDSGAVLVTNAGAAPITLTNLTIGLPLPASGSPGSPTCVAEKRPITFNLWFGQQFYYGNTAKPAYDGGPVTIPAGGQAIFAGTTSDGTYQCPSGNYPSGPTGGTYDFDTSDAYFLDGCTPTTDTQSAPRIVFSAVGYAPTTYVDGGHTIDTGGIDTGNCDKTSTNSGWPNEGLGWRTVSSVCGEGCPTNQLQALTSKVGVEPTSATSVAATEVTSTGGSFGVSRTTLYGIAAATIVIIVAAGYLATRGRKPTP